MSGIQILIDIRNSPEIFAALLEIFEYKVGWIIDANAFVGNEHWEKYRNQTARYFCIDLEDRRFSWSTHDEDATARGRYQIVETVEDAISIAEFAVANADVFKYDLTKPFVPVHPEPTPEPVIQNDYDLSYIDLEVLKKLINTDSVISFKKKVPAKNYYVPISIFDSIGMKKED